MSKRVKTRQHAKKATRWALVTSTVAAFTAPFVLGLQPVSAADGTVTTDLVFKTPAGTTISCPLLQRVVTDYRDDPQVVLAESTLDGTANECKSGSTLSQRAYWYNPSGDQEVSNFEVASGPPFPRKISRRYSPVGEVSEGRPFTTEAVIHFVNCIPNSPAGNVCDFTVTTPFTK